ncbi:hypothetical protein CXG50_12715 [Pseudomonas plecoglossicida]|uniref:Uncharacterized protein n=1 Tax=Pseudomonas plecoglossicida TaxID=70775 RepID=A0A2A3M9M0_PSEDL|nr:hypothetical protein CMV24_03125 [Pseudomonas plecoglossicida]PJI74319.1 hypothetical protein CSW00_08040 [Pseudomonas sp. MR 02]PLP89067.1 hypothetical protein CX682_18815 [Pseudomonas sp. FFUP_PS_41]QKK95328.1 hypothetical protein GEV38_04600 [Pseudomonas sp. 13159349]TXH99898.1 MAG: hypothetical protein E6Q70_24105 [Pseudomonas monteilii]
MQTALCPRGSPQSLPRRPEHRIFALALASERAIVQAPQIATSGGRAKGLRREVTGMDARQALRPHGWGLQRVLSGAGP